MAPISDIDRQIYSSLYERYSGKLLGVCLRYVNDPEVAKDLLHDSFIVIFSRLDTLREQDKMESWMCGIVRNIALKHIEQQKKFAETDINKIQDIKEVEEIMETGLSFEALMAAVDELPTQYGKVFKLSVLEGLTHHEIGDILGIAPHSSSSNLARAKYLLRKIINQNWGILITLVMLLFAILYVPEKDADFTSGEYRASMIHDRHTVEILTGDVIGKPEDLLALAPRLEAFEENVMSVPDADVDERDTIEDMSYSSEDVWMEAEEDVWAETEEDIWAETEQTRKKDSKKISFRFGFDGQSTNSISQVKAMKNDLLYEYYYGLDSNIESPGQEGKPDEGEKENKNENAAKAFAARRATSVDDMKSYGYQHFMPLSFSASVDISLNNRMYFSTGLKYTYLQSRITYNAYNAMQSIHYLGIPAKVSYTFWESRSIRTYGSAGILYEIPLAARLGKTKVKAPAQWSAGAGAGIQFNITHNLGLYVEPEVNYYLETGSDIRTIRSDRQLDLTIPVGIRFTW